MRHRGRVECVTSQGEDVMNCRSGGGWVLVVVVVVPVEGDEEEEAVVVVVVEGERMRMLILMLMFVLFMVMLVLLLGLGWELFYIIFPKVKKGFNSVPLEKDACMHVTVQKVESKVK